MSYQFRTQTTGRTAEGWSQERGWEYVGREDRKRAGEEEKKGGTSRKMEKFNGSSDGDGRAGEESLLV
jgi:hypothetical protein